jgi:hypothetical protein
MNRYQSPSEARREALAVFARRYRITCACSPYEIELEIVDGVFRCAEHGTPVLYRHRQENS